MILSPNPLKFVTTVQETVENSHYSSRIHLLKLDDVLDQQRKVTYSKRNELLNTSDITEQFESELNEYLDYLVKTTVTNDIDLKDDKLEFFIYQINELFGLTLNKNELVDLEEDELRELIQLTANEFFASLTELLEDETVKNQVRNIMIKTLDQMWLEHMERIESLKEGIHLRGYAQEDPYRLFTMEGFELFNESTTSFQYNMATKVYAFKKV